MTEAQHSPSQDQTGQPQRPARKHPLHRVCIQCNSMFVVDPAHLDAKQCPNCHKG